MRLEALISEIKELADECVMKYGSQCVESSDGMLTAYLASLLGKEELKILQRYQQEMLKLFRERAKESIDWLNA